MFIEKQTSETKEYYSQMLSTVGSLSRLFSENSEPYIAYRVAENLFCKAFDALNLSRGDTSADASKSQIGFGIKTFLHKNGSCLEKVAEFNKDYRSFTQLSHEEQVFKISELRNERIRATKRIASVDNIIYHCVTRDEKRIYVHEEPMNEIDLSSIRKISYTGSAITFYDSLEEYSFNISKSTLFKRFHIDKVLLNIPVEIIEDPFEVLEKLREQNHEFPTIEKPVGEIYLPLYSKRGSIHVPERSGLNQWNAGGRARHHDEIYIPIPLWIHHEYPEFFPPRDISFTLYLPNGKLLSAKICQEGGKALMSNPNQDLGKWLLRDVLALQPRELLTYDHLQQIGLDSVIIIKHSDLEFEINFTRIGSFEEFESKGKKIL